MRWLCEQGLALTKSDHKRTKHSRSLEFFIPAIFSTASVTSGSLSGLVTSGAKQPDVQSKQATIASTTELGKHLKLLLGGYRVWWFWAQQSLLDESICFATIEISKSTGLCQPHVVRFSQKLSTRWRQIQSTKLTNHR